MNDLKGETFYLTVSLVDRFLSRSKVEMAKLQLLAVTCMHIASKYEEIHPPRLDEGGLETLLHHWGITKEDVLTMEVTALNIFNFDLSLPSPLAFLELMVFKEEHLPEYVSLCKYMLKLTLFDYDSMKYLPSHLAAAALFLAETLVQVAGEALDEHFPPDAPHPQLEGFWEILEVSPALLQLLRVFNLTEAELRDVADQIRSGIIRLIHTDLADLRYYRKLEVRVYHAMVEAQGLLDVPLLAERTPSGKQLRERLDTAEKTAAKRPVESSIKPLHKDHGQEDHLRTEEVRAENLGQVEMAGEPAPALSAGDYKALIAEIYAAEDPAKLRDLDRLFETYRGEEKKMYAHVCLKYGVPPRAASNGGDQP
jgi:hypothetical protein